MEETEAASTAVDVVCALFASAAVCGGGPADLEAQCAAAMHAPAIYRLEAEGAADRATLEQVLEVLERRLQGPLLCQLEAHVEPDGTLTVQIASLAGPEPLAPALLAPAKLDFYLVDDTRGPDEIAPGYAVLPDLAGAPVTVRWESQLPPNPVATATAVDRPWGLEISVRLTDDAAAALAAVTAAHVNERLAIVVDDVVYMAPRIAEPIPGGALVIAGGFAPEKVAHLAAALNGGALPDGVTLTVLSVEAGGAE